MITQIDNWFSLSMDDISKMEVECMEELKEMIKSAEISQAYSCSLFSLVLVLLLVFK